MPSGIHNHGIVLATDFLLIRREGRYSGLTHHITAAAAMLKITTPTAGDKVVMRYVVHERIQTKEPNKIKRRKLTASNGGGLCAAFSCPNPFEIELASESGTDESVQGTEVTGTRWTPDSGVSSWCTLPASFEFCNEFGLESVESFRRELVSSGEKSTYNHPREVGRSPSAPTRTCPFPPVSVHLNQHSSSGDWAA
ncbi:hypothetical protein PILCRDRAFT_735729 [Piloderma croceum F 1598]|uniref:Uncharacterized protein n=1 Tax=Piloderma croceum (strain F 1598) TaxID=765440 RepID=A0A0C3B6D5_PILCF|nr:hypothetical protein PILCRDRAFT_735729 [Piloderma croceum F 1598]